MGAHNMQVFRYVFHFQILLLTHRVSIGAAQLNIMSYQFIRIEKKKKKKQI
ncbi:hypothetical protein QJS04_geneDACA017901 [Acorus gramineus]|uniref:Uncharacterized protein n=1 Tax=Acorus gramineus TaxID=55184 RepID=A0AAV9ALX1_ACOGR|nr:hypothetical protein QJS04_geneDACA017901 [Acorus gramineus]